MPGLAALLMLADGRYPSGAHAHSGGLEAAAGDGRVRDLDDLAAFLRGRLATAGLVAACFAAAARARPAALAELDAALDARTPSPALRLVSRRQGRALARAALASWPLPPLPAHPHGTHHPVVLGAVAAAAGLSTEHAALAAAYGSIAGPAGAAVRLLRLDPFAVQAVLTSMSAACEGVASDAAGRAAGPVDALPSAAAPLLDVAAEVHARWEVRLFAS